MKVEITEYDDGRKCVAFDDIIVTEKIGEFYRLAPGESIPDGYTVLDPLADISIKGNSIFFGKIRVDKFLQIPKEYFVLLVSDGAQGSKVTNYARAVTVLFETGTYIYNTETGETSEYEVD